MEFMLFRLKNCHIPLSPLFTAESITSGAEVLTIFFLLFVITALFNFTGTIAAALAIIMDCLWANGYLPSPRLKALHQD